jgi:hypothetical protein
MRKLIGLLVLACFVSSSCAIINDPLVTGIPAGQSQQVAADDGPSFWTTLAEVAVAVVVIGAVVVMAAGAANSASYAETDAYNQRIQLQNLQTQVSNMEGQQIMNRYRSR